MAMSKNEPSMESLIAEFFQFSVKVIKSFILGSYLGIRLYMETFQRFSLNLSNFQWPLSGGNRFFCILHDQIINEFM